MGSKVSTKRCIDCKKSKTPQEFNKNAARKDGLQNRCRLCDQQRARGNYRAAGGQRREAIYNKRLELRRGKQKFVFDYLCNHPCIECGEADPLVLEFDHLDPKKKDAHISELVYHASWKRLEAEIAKCEIRCANCHRRKTAHQLGWWVTTLVVGPGIEPGTRGFSVHCSTG